MILDKPLVTSFFERAEVDGVHSLLQRQRQLRLLWPMTCIYARILHVLFLDQGRAWAGVNRPWVDRARVRKRQLHTSVENSRYVRARHISDMLASS